MSTTTDKLALFKYDPSTDGAQTFNIKQALNDNWDKLDDAVKQILITLANKAPATHAAQHAKDGSDPITPESIGAAPGGFGLGEASIAFSDANDCVTNGWYCDVNGTAANTPFPWCHILVSTFMGNGMYVRQDAYITGESNVSTRHMVRFKHPNITDNNGWSVWEWEHGMYMSPGVEYRTTERYLGKPVYTKAINFGTLPSNSAKAVSHGIKNMDVCFMVYGHETANHRPIPTPCLNGNFDTQIGITVTAADIVIHTTFDAGNNTAIVVVKYTKTTD